MNARPWLIAAALLAPALALLVHDRQRPSQDEREPSYEDNFKQSISQALDEQAGKLRAVPEAQRREEFDRQQQAIIAAELARQAARDEARLLATEEAWKAYYQETERCLQPADKALEADCAEARARARDAFELFHEPGEIELR